MRTSIFRVSVLCIVTTIVLVGCSSGLQKKALLTHEPVVQYTIADVLRIKEELSTFQLVWSGADILQVVDDPGSYTLFAPVNSAMDMLPEMMVLNLLVFDSQTLRTWMGYHLLPRNYPMHTFTDEALLPTINSISGSTVAITKQGEQWYVNTARILEEYTTDNGTLYMIDDVLFPPDLDIATYKREYEIEPDAS